MTRNPALDCEWRPGLRLSTVWVGDTLACTTHGALAGAMARTVIHG